MKVMKNLQMRSLTILNRSDIYYENAYMVTQRV